MTSDYAMQEIPQSYIMQTSPNPILISNPKKWANLVEEEEEET